MTRTLRNLGFIALTVVALVATLLLLPGPEPTAQHGNGSATVSSSRDGAIALVGVRLFNGREVIEDAAVVWADGVILSAGADVELPADAERIDGAGRTALPGLIDAHVHAFGGAQSDAARFGVTTLLDMFRPPDDFDRQHADRESRAPTGRADLFSAGYLATVEGGHGTQYGIDVPIPDGPEQAQDWVDARLAEGSDWIKIVVEGGRAWNSEIPSLDAATVAALVEAAHARDALAVAHVSTRAEADLAVEAGVDGLVHLFGDEIVDDETARDWAERGLFVIPTTPVLASAYGQPGPGRLARFSSLEPLLSSEQRRSLSGSFPGAGERSARWSNVSASIRNLHEAGVPLLAGSDAPNPGTAHGLSLLDAVIRLNESGLSPVEALRSASQVPAKTFEMIGDDDPRGCLRRGCRADLLLVFGDPTDEVTDLLRIDRVWKNGSEVERRLPEPDSTDATGAALPVDLLASRGRWMAAADDYMDGASDAALAWSESGLRAHGTLRPGFAFPYAGAMWYAADIPMQPVDGRGWSTLKLSVSGEVDVLRVMFFSAESNQPVWRDVEPGDVEIALDELAGVDLSAFQAVGVFAAGSEGDFDFTVGAARLE